MTRVLKDVMNDVDTLAPSGYFTGPKDFTARVIHPIACGRYMEHYDPERQQLNWWATFARVTPELRDRFMGSDFDGLTRDDWQNPFGVLMIVDFVKRPGYPVRTVWDEGERGLIVSGEVEPGDPVMWVRRNGRIGWGTVREHPGLLMEPALSAIS